MKTLVKFSLIVTLFVCGTLQAQTTTFKGTLQVKSTWSNTKTGGSTIRESFSDIMAYENFGVGGTNAFNKGDMTKIVVKTGILTNSVETIINLSSIANSFGDILAFDKVKFLAIQVGGTETNTVYQLGGDFAGSGGFPFGQPANSFDGPFGQAGQCLKVKSSGFMMLLAPNYDGYQVGTATNLLVKNISAGTSTNTAYTIWVGGI